MLAPIVDALAKLHRLGVVHGDLSLSKVAVRFSKNDRVNIQVHGFDHAACLKSIKGQSNNIKALGSMPDDVYALG